MDLKHEDALTDAYRCCACLGCADLQTMLQLGTLCDSLTHLKSISRSLGFGILISLKCAAALQHEGCETAEGSMLSLSLPTGDNCTGLALVTNFDLQKPM